jgi:pilus assembly protein CpaF
VTQQQKVFDISEYLQQHGTTKQVEDSQRGRNVVSFEEVWKRVKEYFSNIYDGNKLSSQEQQKRLEIEYSAMIGDVKAERFLIDEIEQFLRDENLSNVTVPPFYNSPAHACYHEIYGFGNFAKWEKYPHSTDGAIIGKEIWFNISGQFVQQSEALRSEEQLWEIIRTLQMKVKGLKINESNPQGEFDREDGTRIKVIVPPRAFKPTILFRRFIINKYSFKEQARLKTIPMEDVPMHNVLSQLHLNTIIAGAVQSGKSTFLKTIYSARDPKKVAILIETSPESYLKRDFPDRLVHDFYTSDGNIHQVIRDALRVPHDYLIVQEVRGVEAEGAISGTERGTRGLLMSYHLTNPKNTPRQLAKHIIDEFPTRNERSEIERIAEQLDIGITMATVENNEKRLTSLYEICYDDETREAWINYLIKYEKENDSWEYNANVSEQLIAKMNQYDKNLTVTFLNLLQARAKQHPMITQDKMKCY